MTFEALFIESKGQPIVHEGRELKMVDRIDLPSDKVLLKINFISTNSNWKQGIALQTNGDFDVNGKKLLNQIVLWEDTAPKNILLLVESKDKVLVTYNVWETEDGTMHYWHNGGAMYVEERGSLRTYQCNDGYPDDDLDDLIYTINYTSHI